MHPAPSIIIFTALSGLGFGMLAWLGVIAPKTESLMGSGGVWFFVIAIGLSSIGLIASTLHLGNPKNAWKAFSQWRSSWLSREGICAVFTLSIMAVYGGGLVFLQEVWVWLGYVGAFLAILTVFTTSMIYAQLKTVPRWNSMLTPCLFVLLSFSGGSMLVGYLHDAMLLLILTGVCQWFYWRNGDRSFKERGSNIGTATSLGDLGKVRLLESPHTGTNYLLKEMVYVVGRKHALKLRIIGLFFLSVFPVLLLLMPVAYEFRYMMGFVSLVSHVLGLFVVRWLFFAEAEHVVGLYYGKR